MKHYLTFQDDKSDKFWQIEVSGNSFTVTYGKIGSSGQTQTKTFNDEETCLKEVKKLFSEKLKKGYIEVETPTSSINPSSSDKKASASAKTTTAETKSKIDKPAPLTSETFHQFLKIKSKDISSSKYSKILKNIDWENLAEDIFDSVYKYWEELSKKEKSPIGIFDIRWDDANTDYCIEFDYDLESNNPKNAMEEGAIRNVPVVDFSNFIKNQLKQKPEKIREVLEDEDFSVIKNILCKLTQEVILQTLKVEVFKQIPKQQPYFLMFSYYHDEDASVFFDSNTKEQKDLYSILKIGQSPLFKYFLSGEQSLIISNVSEIDLTDISLFENLKNFNISDCENIISLKSLSELKNIQSISIKGAKLSEFPDFLLNLPSLKSLYLTNSSLSIENKTSIFNSSQLESLCLNANSLTTIPEFVFQLPQLKKLLLMDNQLTELPDRLADLKFLQSLNLSGNKIAQISNLNREFSEVRELGLFDNRLVSLDGIRCFPKLKELLIWGNELETISPEISSLKNLTRIGAERNKISSFPNIEIAFESVINLSLDKNQLTQIPEGLTRLFPNLKSLGLSDNQLEEIPADLFKNFPKLDTLSLSNNQLSDLPKSIARLESLKNIYLKNNRFVQIPEILKELKKLKDISLSGNQISELPEFLSEMTELKELKIGNNPIAQNPESVEAKIKVINPKITLYFS
ncbi:leucine rich repeat protein [Leptospira kirschneri serovar Bim str. 1051]|uniref:LIC_11051 family fibronectin-binding protein n=1 Tax=Leptospira kirschneri TaxID=29507 RepID=UPI0002BF919A|nr:leucine-rich repeat domain-containing protein [Leptospira kirschneri]EMK18165.1 leucine rich repeat protein [Leptospira kirschneri serovar Bim str. PUO 1247]EMN03014.1 leucine rich repeat protein [Leptospira kirschneri serovar Bim str. 1051]